RDFRGRAARPEHEVRRGPSPGSIRPETRLRIRGGGEPKMTRENQDFDFLPVSPPVIAAAPPIVPSSLRATSKGRPVSGEGDLGGAARTIDRVARADCSVLITGDRSPALDNVARALHDRSMRGESPFVAV